MDSVAKTGLCTAMLRALESARPDRLFLDPLAETLAGPDGAEALATMEAGAPGLSQNPGPIIRTRFFDDTLEHILDKHGLDQVVLLAAGMDARAFRLRLTPTDVVFELDRPAMLDLKAARLAQANATPRCRRVPVAADLTGDWSAPLEQAGFDCRRPTVWIAEGLSPYLTETQLHDVLFRPLTELSAEGSWLIFDVFGHASLISAELAELRTMMDTNGAQLRFSTDHPEDLATAHGWHPEVTRIGNDGVNYDRWTAPDSNRPAYAHLVVAHR